MKRDTVKNDRGWLKSFIIVVLAVLLAASLLVNFNTLKDFKALEKRVNKISSRLLNDNQKPEENNFVIIDEYPNDDIRTYHTRFDNLTEKEMQQILAIPGVVSGLYGTEFREAEYKLRMVKGGAFSWDEIEPGVLCILKRHVAYGIK